MASQLVNKALSFPKQLFVFALVIRGFSRASERVNVGRTFYATKTAYENSFTPDEASILENPSAVFAPPTCKPIHVTGLYRHGTRYPGPKDIKNGRRLAQKLKNKINNEFAFLNQWDSQFPLERAKKLCDVGSQELKKIGHRFGLRFSELILGADPSELYFQVTSRSRARESADSFLVGLNEALLTDISTSFILKEDLLRFYDNCTEFVQTVENSYEAMKEFHTFGQGPEVRRVRDKVVEKLGLEKEALELVDVKALYTHAAFEIAAFGWTDLDKLFDEEDLRVLEYTADLKNYWRKGRGYPINYEQACVLLTDFMTIMETAQEYHKTGKLYSKIVQRFAHAESLMSLLCLFGLGEEKEPPTADNFHKVKDQQTFRGGKYAPFAGNVNLVLYHCSDENWQGAPLDYDSVPPGVSFPDHLEEYMVQLLQNELPIKFPFCEHHLCSYDTVKEQYSQYVGCNFEKLCKLEKYRGLRDEL